MKKRMTPLGALLGLNTLAAAAPETFGPSPTYDRRTHQPADLGHGAASPASMASFAGKMTHGPADVLGAGSGKIDELIDGGETGHAKTDTAAVQGLDTDAATGAATNTKQSS